MTHSATNPTGIRRKVASQYRRSSVVLSFNHDGLQLARVKNNRRWLPLFHIVAFIYLAMVIRLVVIAEIGPSGYSQRMAELRDGNMLERVAASVMAMDPVSQAIAGHIRSGFHTMNGVFEREVYSN